MTGNRFRRFTIRSTLIAVALLAMVAAWFGNSVNRQNAAAQAVARLGGLADRPTTTAHQWMNVNEGTLGRLFNPACELFTCVEFGMQPNRDAIIDRTFLDSLDSIKQLRAPWLGLQHAKLTPVGYNALFQLAFLRGVDLSHSTISDADIKMAAQLKDLRYLNLTGTSISDTGIEHLHELTTLEELWIDHSLVSPNAIKKLRDAIPNLKVISSPSK